MTNVTASASGGTSNYGIYDAPTIKGSAVMENVTATATGGNSSCAMWVVSSATMHNVTATATGATVNNQGINSSGSLLTMNNVTVTGTGGSANVALYLQSWTVLSASELMATSDYISNDSNCTAKIHNSIISAGIMNYGGLSLANTRLDGGVMTNTGTMKCINSFDSNYNPITCP